MNAHKKTGEAAPRGRPPKPAPLSAAERARRYRAKQKAAGLMKRYVDPAQDTTATADLAYWIARSQSVGDELRTASSARDYFKSEVERLHLENEQLWARMREAEQINTIQLKELIVTKDKLAALQRQTADGKARTGGVPAPRTRKPRQRK